MYSVHMYRLHKTGSGSCDGAEGAGYIHMYIFIVYVQILAD